MQSSYSLKSLLHQMLIFFCVSYFSQIFFVALNTYMLCRWCVTKVCRTTMCTYTLIFCRFPYCYFFDHTVHSYLSRAGLEPACFCLPIPTILNINSTMEEGIFSKIVRFPRTSSLFLYSFSKNTGSETTILDHHPKMVTYFQ
jgi:hypothetical protein